MATKKSPITTLLLLVFLLIISTLFCSLSFSLSVDDDHENPSSQDSCERRCRRETQDEQQRRLCVRRCEQRRESEQGSKRQGDDQEKERDVVLINDLAVISSGTSSSEVEADRRDPQRECETRCRKQAGQDEASQRQCQRRCEDEQRRRQEQDQEDSTFSRGADPGCCCGEDSTCRCSERCRHRCQRASSRERHDAAGSEMSTTDSSCHCSEGCQTARREYRRQQRDQRRESSRGSGERIRGKAYVWDKNSWETKFKSEDGVIRSLPRFSEKMEILEGFDNLRVEWIDMNPNTVCIPHHKDADGYMYVVRGRGTVMIMRGDKQESHDIREGDILAIPAGVPAFAANTDSKEKLRVVKLMNTISTWGHYEEFYGIGDEPRSFLGSFSREVLEAAFNTQHSRLRKVFSGKRDQSTGIIRKASGEQIRELSRGGGSGGGHGVWPFPVPEPGVSSKGPYNLMKKKPLVSSRRGHIHAADGDDYRPLRRDDIAILLANITGGSMIVPSYNSRSGKVSVVTRGNGYVEIICPHMSGHGGGCSGGESEEDEDYYNRGGRSSAGGRSMPREREEDQESEEEEEGSYSPGRGRGSSAASRRQRGRRSEGREGTQEYQRCRSKLSPGTVFFVPAGHPYTIVAEEDLNVLCFETESSRNHQYFLAGGRSMYRNMDRSAKELFFGASAKEVDRVLEAQDEDVIVGGPEETRGGRGHEDA